MNIPFRVILSLALPGFLALASAADPRSAVEAAERAWAAAVVKTDTATLEKVLATGLVYIHASGTRDTRTSFIENNRTGKLKYDKLDHQEIEVQMIKPDVAFLTGRADVRVVSAGKAVDMKVALLHVWVKRQGRWQMLAHQAARLP